MIAAIYDNYFAETINPFSEAIPPFEKRCYFLLVVSTPLKNISQIGDLPQVGVKIKNN